MVTIDHSRDMEWAEKCVDPGTLDALWHKAMRRRLFNSFSPEIVLALIKHIEFLQVELSVEKRMGLELRARLYECMSALAELEEA